MEYSVTLAPCSSPSIHTSRYANKKRWSCFIRVGLPWISPPLSSTFIPPRASEVHITVTSRARRRTRKKSDGLNVELEIFKFMQRSPRPDNFPTKEELIAGGRGDLVEAALNKGGWLTFGWESETPNPSKPPHVNGASNISKDEARRLDVKNGSLIVKDEPRRLDVKTDAQRLPAELVLTKETSLPAREFKENVKRNEDNARETSQPQLDVAGPSLARSRARRRQPKSIIDNKGKENSKTTELPNAEASHERWRRKRRKELQTDNTTVKNALDWIQDMVQRREQWIMESMSKPSQQSVRASKSKPSASMTRLSKGVSPTLTRDTDTVTKPSVPDMKASKETPAGASSFNDRLRNLETKLLSTRAALKSGRASLLKGEDKLLQVQRKTGEELARATDSLEFRENEIIHTRAELRRSRAQVTALQAKMALELSEARKATEEKQVLLDKAEAALKMMRLVRIVWPSPASHVLLTGSFDGWTNKIKMEKSGAGVFVTALHLYPGRYEVKFIVDGTWRVDACRPITYTEGIENNLLVVL